MNTEMDIKEIIAGIDALLQAGEDEKAEKELIQAIAQYTEVQPNHVVGQSILWNELGSFYRFRKIFDKGEEAYLKAKNLLESLREHADESINVNYATTLNNLAGLYRMSHQLQKAMEMFDRAIAVYEGCAGSVSPDYLASVYNNKGLVSLDMKEVEQARTMFLKARKILEAGGDYKFALGTTLSNLAFASVFEKKFSEAAAFLREAKVLFEEAGSHEMAQTCEEFLWKLGER